MILSFFLQIKLSQPGDVFHHRNQSKVFKTMILFFFLQIKLFQSGDVLHNRNQSKVLKTMILSFFLQSGDVFHIETSHLICSENEMIGFYKKCSSELKWVNAAGNYLFKVNNRNTGTRCEIYSKLTIKTPEPRNWRRLYYYLFFFGTKNYSTYSQI